MEPDIRNFKGLENLIRKRPKEADKLAAEWDRFVKIHPQDRMFFTTRERFFAWAEKHPQLHIDTSIWVGKEVIEAYSYVREQREERQELDKQLGLPAGPSPSTLADFAMLPFLAAMYLNKPKIMQDDEDYRAILERKKQEWLEKNPGKDFTSKEGLDYLYGSLENSDKPPIDQETEEEFRANKKFAGKVKRYDKEKAKIYKNPDDDPQLKRLKAEIDEHAQARFAHLQKINPATRPEDVRRSVERRSYLMFAYQYEDKAKQYALSNDQIKAALDIKETEQMASAGGRQIRVAERTRPAYSGISPEEIERRLQAALSQQPATPSGGLVIPSGQPIPSGDDGGGDEQPQQSSQPQGGGGHGGRSRGMDLANRLLPKKKKPPLPKTPGNPLDKLRNRLLLQAVRFILGFFIGSTPFIIVVLVLIGVFVIVGFGPIDISGLFQPQPAINQCVFTRSNVGRAVKSTTLQNWITEAANAAGVPAAILASVAMHESENFTANADDDHDAIKANNYTQEGHPFCVEGGDIVKRGPNDLNKNPECTQEELDRGAKNAKAIGFMQILDIYNPGRDLHSITGSLALATEKLKSRGLTQQPTKEQVDAAIKGYHNSCIYTVRTASSNIDYSYCDEVWNDYQRCQTGSLTGVVSSCPVPDGKIKVGSFDPVKDTGHCSTSYGTCAKGADSRLAKSIDVDTEEKEVVFPTINGEQLEWFFVPDFIFKLDKKSDCEKGVSNCGKGYIFQAQSKKDGGKWTLHLLHIDENKRNFDPVGPNLSGKLVGKTVGGVYLHVNIGKDITNYRSPPLGSEDITPGWIKPEDIGMCTK